MCRASTLSSTQLACLTPPALVCCRGERHQTRCLASSRRPHQRHAHGDPLGTAHSRAVTPSRVLTPGAAAHRRGRRPRRRPSSSTAAGRCVAETLVFGGVEALAVRCTCSAGVQSRGRRRAGRRQCNTEGCSDRAFCRNTRRRLAAFRVWPGRRCVPAPPWLAHWSSGPAVAASRGVLWPNPIAPRGQPTCRGVSPSHASLPLIGGGQDHGDCCL